MELSKQSHEVLFDYIPACLVKLRWKTIRTGCLIVFHLEDSFPYFLLAKRLN
jgi:hypothetical protein